MGKIIGDGPCPECRKKGRDSTGNHLIEFDDGNKSCNRCGYFERDGERTIPPSQFTIDHNYGSEVLFHTISTLQSKTVEARKVSAETYSHYAVKMECSEANGEIIAVYYPISKQGKVTGYKKRTLPKSFSTVGDGKGKIELFGQRVCEKGSKNLIITGGEEDCIAMYQVLQAKYPTYTHAVTSLPKGENCSAIKDNLDFIRSFEKVILALDMDEAGQQATKKIADLIGPGVYQFQISEKDISDMHTNGKDKELISQYWNCKKYSPSGIISIDDIGDEAIEQTTWGLDYPFPELTKLTYGLKTKCVIGIGAGPGTGKTTFIQQLQKHLVYEHNEKIGIFSLEEDAAWTVRKLVGSIIKKPIHLPDCEYDIDKAREIKNSLNDKIYLFDHNEYQDWEDIVSAIRYFRSEGVKWFFIDPLSALVAHLNASDGNTFLNANMFNMERMAKSLDCTFFHVNHLNNPSAGKDHGAGGKVYGSQFSGSRAQWKYSTDLWGLERDQLAEDEEEKNIVTFSNIKSRLSGNTKTFQMRYNRDNGLLEEYQSNTMGF